MYTLNDIINEYKRLDILFGNNIVHTVKIGISRRCTKRLDVYKFNKQRNHIYNEEIIISDFMLNAPENEFLDTIRHEYAHVLATRQAKQNVGHGEMWQYYAQKVGATPKQYASENCEAQKQRIAEKESKQKQYKITCDECGHVWIYHKKSKIVKLIESGNYMLSCPYCKNEKFSLENT